MRWLAGQVARACGWLLHHLAQTALAIVVLVAVLVGALAWRLSQGPLEVSWLARRIESAVNSDPAGAHITIGEAAVAWNGWQAGAAQPLALHFANIAATAPDGADLGHVEAADVALSPARLLIGQIVPRSIEIRGARLVVERKPDGSIAIANAPDGQPVPPGDTATRSDLSGVITETAKPPQTDRDASRTGEAARWSQIRRLRIHDSSVKFADRKLGLDATVPHLEADLRRREQGGVEGDADVRIAIGAQTLHLTAHATPTQLGGQSAVTVNLDSINPADIARAAPAFSPFAQLDAPVSVTADAILDASLHPVTAHAHATLGSGKAQMGEGTLSFLDAEFDAMLSESGNIDARVVKIGMAARPGAPRTTITATLAAHRSAGKYAADIAINLDRVAFADLPALWPVGLGGKGTRPWITKNITAGSAHDLHIKAALSATADLSVVDLVSVSGGLDGSDLTTHWLRPVPPIEHGEAHLAFIDPDTINIAVTAGRQTPGVQNGGVQNGGAQGVIAVKAGNVKLTGLAGRHQFGDIDADLAGGLADLLTLLKNPKIKLLDKRKIEMRDPSGKFAGHITVGHLPLEANVSIDDLQIKTKTHLTEVHLGGIAAGKDIDQGVLDLDASNDGMHVQGNVRVAAIPLDLVVDMDFRSGPPSEVLMKVAAAGTADEKQLAAAGLDPAGMIAGPVALNLDYESRRDGAGEVTVHADLSRTSVSVDRAGFRKAAGAAATADAHMRLDHDTLAAIDRVHVAGGGILIDGAADVADGRPNVLRLGEVKIGTTTNAHGEIRLPAQASDGYGVTLAGPSLDLSGLLGKKSDHAETKPHDDAPGTKFDADVRFDRIVTGQGRTLDAVVAHVENDGHITRRAAFSGRTAPNAPFRISIEPVVGGRRLAGDVRDLGALLRVGDVTSELNGGHLVINGSFDDRSADHALTASASLEDFRVRGEASLGKILQAMSLYGVVDVLSGPGLNFTRMVAPFRYASGIVTVQDLRAFSSSLGMTAKGRVDLDRRVADLEGTVIPAYFFNSLLGKLPLLGTVFSPERGGGVFSATYSVRGPIDNPSVTVNPLAALTPGFLRGIFGIFDEKTAR